VASITRVATTTLLDEWPNKVPVQAAHLNVDSGVDTPNTASYVRCQEAAGINKRNEYGGYDFSAIPAGSVITAIKVRQYSKNNEDLSTLQQPGVEFSLRINGVARAQKSFSVNTGGVDMAQTAIFDSTGGITRDELATPNAFSVRKHTFSSEVDPPIPDG